MLWRLDSAEASLRLQAAAVDRSVSRREPKPGPDAEAESPDDDRDLIGIAVVCQDEDGSKWPGQSTLPLSSWEPRSI